MAEEQNIRPADPVDGASESPPDPEHEYVKRKGLRFVLLIMFSFSVFIDILSASAFFIYTGTVRDDLEIPFSQQSWIITSYSVTFASFLLFFGRLSDLYSPKPVFAYGFLAVSLLNLVLSFLPDRYSFFVIRALVGIASASLVPSAYRLISTLFPPEEHSFAFTVYGMTASIANSCGTMIAGVIGVIATRATAWRWFFRLVFIITLPIALGSLWLIPRSQNHSPKMPGKWKRLDPVGTLCMLCAIVLLILGMTLGADHGFATPAFLVPFLISLVVLFPFFFWYEAHISPELAILPPSIWRLPNLTVLIIFSLLIVGYWGVNFVVFVELFMEVHGESDIVAAVRILPEGVVAAVVSFTLIAFPKYIAHPKWPNTIALLLGAASFVLWTQATSVVGEGYWRYVFPGMLIGSGGMQVALLGTNVGVMMAVPRSQSGVAGALLQTAQQTSNVIALAIQAGLLTIEEGGISNFANVRASWYFELGWIMVWLIGFVLLYRPNRTASGHEQRESEEQEMGPVHV